MGTSNYRRKKIAWIITVFFVLAAGGCAFVHLALGDKIYSTFNHKLHADAGLGCTDCHVRCVEIDKPETPMIDACTGCHDENESGTNYAKWKTNKSRILMNEPIPLSRKVAGYDDVIFSLADHHNAGIGCAECHPGVEDSTKITGKFMPDMKTTCLKCHRTASGRKDEKGFECKDCHRKITKDTKPETHNNAWKRFHGAEVDMEFELMENRCYFCHSQSSCKECHQAQAPRSHTASWRTRTHGLHAETERDSCLVCHQQDYCASCHKAAPPFPPISDHTTGQECVVCHSNLDHGSRMTESFECRKCHK